MNALIRTLISQGVRAMKRLSLLILAGFGFLLGASPARAQKPKELDSLLEKKTYTDNGGKVLRYRLMKPTGYDPKERYPLVVFLHGAGERGSDNEKQLIHGVPEFARQENRQRNPCFLIAPQCPDNEKWAEVDWSAETHKQSKEPAEAGRLVLELIAALQKEYSIDDKRIYLTGLSMGGFGTWDLLARRPNLFAAGVPVCGGGDEGTAAILTHMPLWVFHGAQDNVVKPERSRNMIKALEKAGGKPKYTEYPTEGHASWVPAYKDPEMMKWIFEQKRPK
jgi:predicted peptidase